MFAESHIGSVLAHAPRGEDGAWPHEAVRDLIEHLEDLEFERAIEIGVFNNRGMVSKAMLEGGRQERTLEERYRAYAETTRDGWPRCSRMLARIGASYGADGRSEDTRAEVEEELWR